MQALKATANIPTFPGVNQRHNDTDGKLVSYYCIIMLSAIMPKLPRIELC